MNRPSPRPPGFLRWLAARVVSRRDREDLLADLDDGYSTRRQGGRGSAVWYLAQAVHAGWTRRQVSDERPRGTGMVRLHACWSDCRYALRRLRQERAFTAAVVATLALSTGPAIAAFSLANWFYLRPMPGVTHPDRLIAATFGTPNARGVTVSRVSYDHLRALVAVAPSVVGMAGWQPLDASVAVGSETPRIVNGEFVTGNFFGVLGVRMQAGRPIHPDDDRSPLDPPVAVLSHSLARTLFVDRDPVGQSIRVNGHPVTVVGVAPRGFLGNTLLQPAALWLPGLATPRINHYPPESRVFAPDRGPFYMHVARLAEGATLEQANVELTAAALALAGQDSQAGKFKTVRANLQPGFAAVPPTFGPIVGILLGAGVVLVLLGAANLANLFAFRAVRHAHEGAIRRALGASAGRVAQFYLIHAGLIAALGCSAAVGLAVILTTKLNGVVLPPETSVPIDWRVGSVILALSGVLAIVLGATPSRVAARWGLAQIMARRGRGATAGGRRIRTSLAVVQVVLSLTLFVGAMLFTTSLRNLRAVDLGFQPDGVSVFRFGFRLHAYAPERMVTFYRDVLADVGRQPGVRAAAVTEDLPVQGGGVGWRIAPGGSDPKTAGVEISYTAVTSGYFDAIGTRFVAGGPGADWTAAATAAETIVISRSLAERLFGTHQAVGRMATFPPSAGRPAFDVRIAGVAEDVRFNGLTGERRDLVYRPFVRGLLNHVLIVRSSSDAVDIAAVVRRAAAAIDPALPIIWQTSMHEIIDRHLGPRRLFAWTSSLLAALGFILAAVGIYGLMGQAAAERTREFGIRLALGAERRTIRWLVLRSTLLIVAVGAPLGLTLAAVGSRLVSSQLFGVTAADPVIYALAAGALGTVVICSGAVPAWRASRANPADVMRVE